MDEIITWEKIRDVQREEKNSQKLSKLDPKFFEKVHDYISKKRSIGKNEEEIQNIKRIVDEIINIRIRKITTYSSYGAKIDNMTIKEKDIFNEIKKIVDKYKNDILTEKEIPKEETKEEEKTEPLPEPEKINLDNRKIIKSLATIPDFVGHDLKTYSIKSGELIVINEEIADLLVKKGKAEYVNIE